MQKYLSRLKHEPSQRKQSVNRILNVHALSYIFMTTSAITLQQFVKYEILFIYSQNNIKVFEAY